MLFCIPTGVVQGHNKDDVPLVNGILIAINIVAYWFSRTMAVGPDSGIFSVVTYAFAHASLTHLIINMWVLWVFGNPVNRRIGNAWYALAYMGTIVALGVIARTLSGSSYLVGSSGGIFAVVAICLVLMPGASIRVVYLIMFPATLLAGLISKPKDWLRWFVRWGQWQIRAWWCLFLVPALELWGLFWWGWNWTNLAHLMGLACGVAVVLLLPERISMNRRPAFNY